nr:hypothetical protein [Deltaproteobacteria bacterium]
MTGCSASSRSFPPPSRPGSALGALPLELSWIDADLARTDPTRFLEEVDAVRARGLRLAAVSAVQFQSGLRMPPRPSPTGCAVGGVLFVDAIQACGSVPIDVRPTASTPSRAAATGG